MVLNYREVFVALADRPDEVLVPFYTQLLGQRPEVYRPKVYAEFRLVGLRLGIFTPQPSHQAEFQTQSSGSMSLCLEVEDLEAAIDHLTQMGYPPGDITTASHGRELYAYDPVGNRLILHQAC